MRAGRRPLPEPAALAALLRQRLRAPARRRAPLGELLSAGLGPPLPLLAPLLADRLLPGLLALLAVHPLLTALAALPALATALLAAALAALAALLSGWLPLRLTPPTCRLSTLLSRRLLAPLLTVAWLVRIVSRLACHSTQPTGATLGTGRHR